MYDITEIFQEIESQLISSMCRNLSRHVDEEQDANANYSQWQTKQLQALERYRKENLKEFSKQFEDINNGLKKYLEMTYNNSKTATEHDIITNLLEDNVPTNAYGVNQEKLKALIKSVTDDFQKAEYSLLRRSNDLYRQTIYKAQVGLNTGSITLNQAVDTATKDFLSNGINSIRYKNGNLVNIASYSEMALRTAEKRATMYGDGEKRQEWDISTVVVYGHNGACPLCSQWQNRVYIDDVYSNGKPNNKYPLLSTAIQGGLYHPNCNCPQPQTYIEGITEPPTQKTPQELKKDIQNYNLEQVQRYHERQIRKYKRLEDNSLDDANKKRYSLKVKEWQLKQRELIDAHPEVLKRDYSREKVRVLNITEPPKNATDIGKINLTSAQNSGNIKEREYEYGVIYGSVANTKKIIDYIDDKTKFKYSSKFKNLTENKKVNQSVCKCSKTIIKHRIETDYEDMYIINANTGKIMGFRNNMHTIKGNNKSFVKYNDSINKALEKAKSENIPIISIHNHPDGYPPSADDLVSALKHGYKFGLAIGHNGQVYKYYPAPEILSIEELDNIQNWIALNYKNGMDIDRAYQSVFEQFGLKYEILRGDEFDDWQT